MENPGLLINGWIAGATTVLAIVGFLTWWRARGKGIRLVHKQGRDFDVGKQFKIKHKKSYEEHEDEIASIDKGADNSG